jgi:hypothetical protein
MQVAASTIPNAGLGLFATRVYRTTDVICAAADDSFVDGADAADSAIAPSRYLYRLASDAYCDMTPRANGDNRIGYVNSPAGTKRRTNVRFAACRRHGRWYLTLRPRRTIRASEAHPVELLASYGPSYWRTWGRGRRRRGASKRYAAAASNILFFLLSCPIG